MGEIAEAMINGLFCSVCGEFLDGEEPGYPRTCVGCGGDTEPQEITDEWIDNNPNARHCTSRHRDADRTPCPHCGKRKKNVQAHIQAVHPPR